MSDMNVQAVTTSPPVTEKQVEKQPAAAKPKPIFSVRPVFDTHLTMIEAAPITIVGIAAGTAVVGTLIYILLYMLGIGKYIPGGAFYTVMFFLSITLTPAAYYELKKRAYARTVCHFYDTYLEFQDFRYFINRRRGRVKYDDIRDIGQQSSLFEGLCHLATVSIYVPGMGYQYTYSNGFSGLRLRGIPERSDLSARLLDLIQSGSNRAVA